MDETGMKPSDTKITAIKTSQTSFSLCEGNRGGAVTVDVGVGEAGLGCGDFTQTSQQKAGAFSLNEGKGK